VASIDLGDLVLDFGFRVKCCPRLKVVWHLGSAIDTDPSDRVIKPPPYTPWTGRIDVVMDLAADKKVPLLAPTFTDEVGNPVPAPAGATFVYTVDDPTIIALTDNGDGTGEAAAVGTLGTANLHLDATFNGSTATGDLQIVVVAGLAERVAINVGPPEEVTPDV